MKKAFYYTLIILSLGFAFFLFSQQFVEEEQEVVTKELVETTIANVYFIEEIKNNKQLVSPVKRKVLKEDFYKNVLSALFEGPNNNEKKKGFSSEIPAQTKLVGVMEDDVMLALNLSSDFESGGGGDSMLLRLEQLRKTVSDMTTKPVYLYINGKEVNTLGGEGLMVKQPINPVQ